MNRQLKNGLIAVAIGSAMSVYAMTFYKPSPPVGNSAAEQYAEFGDVQPNALLQYCNENNIR